MTTAYRTSETPEHRVATVAISRTESWWAGITFGTLFAVIGVFGALKIDTSLRLSCQRDDAGNGSCAYVERHLSGSDTTRWDLQNVRKARVEPRHYKSHMIYPLVLETETGERRLFDDGTSERTQSARARDIDDFVADTSRHHLDIEEKQRLAPHVFMICIALFGMLIGYGVNTQFPARRIVLDDEAGTARFQFRVWRRWREDETLPLEDLDAIEKKIAAYKPERDDAIAEVKAFLR